MTRRPRAVLLHRASTPDQDIELARDELLRHAELRGFEVVEVVEETASGVATVRPGLDQVRELVKGGKVDVVEVWAIDRVGRSLIDLLAFVELLKQNGVTLVTVADGLTVTPDGDAASELILHVLAAAASFERRRLIERTRLGVARARARGKRLGRPRALSPWDERRVVALRAEGRSWSEIAQEVGCSIAAARRAVQRQGETPAERGTPAEPSTTVESLGAIETSDPMPKPVDFDTGGEVPR